MTDATAAAADSSSSKKGSSGISSSSRGAKSAVTIGDINTLMAVDAGRLANLALSLQELWSLPLQIIAAMTLLFLQVW